jgi:hypothetical protein
MTTYTYFVTAVHIIEQFNCTNLQYIAVQPYFKADVNSTCKQGKIFPFHSVCDFIQFSVLLYHRAFTQII